MNPNDFFNQPIILPSMVGRWQPSHSVITYGMTDVDLIHPTNATMMEPPNHAPIEDLCFYLSAYFFCSQFKADDPELFYLTAHRK